MKWTEEAPLKAADIGTMSYGELEIFEEIVGIVPEDEETLMKAPRTKLLLALGFIAAKRLDPATTLEDIRSLPLGAISFANEESEGKE